MTDLQKAAAHRETATRLRKRGDAMLSLAGKRREAGDVSSADRLGSQASESFVAALTELDAALDALTISTPNSIAPDQPSTPDGVEVADWAADAAETLGSRGGILKRLGRDYDALASYEAGALIEQSNGLTTSYCRGNAIKLALHLGTSTLEELQDRIEELHETLQRRMAQPGGAGHPWDWADLGDYKLMLNDVESARTTYTNFVRQADTGAPLKTWNALLAMAAAMRERNDPSADRFIRAVEDVGSVLNPDRARS